MSIENKINNKINDYVNIFKQDICDHISTILKKKRLSPKEEKSIQEFIYNYKILKITSPDFTKRQRAPNVVHLSERCSANRADGKQCTRRRKTNDSVYCGTHIKGTPHGIINSSDETEMSERIVKIWTQDIHGIMYYIDDQNNVYQPEDIIQGHQNPRIIAKWAMNGDTYTIPQFEMYT